MPPAVLASALTRWTRTRSRSGTRERIDLRVSDYRWVLVAAFIGTGIEGIEENEQTYHCEVEDCSD